MTNETTDLIVPIDLDQKQAVALFTEKDEFEKLYAQIKQQTDAHEPDVSTTKGRDEIKSLAYKVTRTKTTLDDLGKGVKEEAQKTVDAVDSARKTMRDKLDALKTQVRKPLTDYEADEKLKDDAVNAALNRLAQLKTVPFDATPQDIMAMQSEVADIGKRNDWRGKEDKQEALIDACQTVLRQALNAAQERERMAIENARLQKEREEIEVKQRAQAEKERLEAEERDRQAKARQQAEAEQKAKIEALERDKKEAEQRAVEAEKRAEREAEQAQQRAKDEADRIEREKLAKIEQEHEEARRQKKAKEERKARLEKSSDAIATHTTLDTNLCRAIIKLIADGKIPHVRFE